MNDRMLTATLLCLVLAGSAGAAAQQWPTHHVRLVLPALAGSSADAAARAIAEKLSAKWKQPVIVENKPGAGTIIGTETVAKADPDGYTLGWIITAHAINATLQPKLPYDSAADFAGVTLLYQLKPVIVVSPDLPVATVDEFVRWAKQRPGQLSYASPGTGSGPHLLGELFRLKYGIDMQHAAYKGTGQAYPDVLSGRVPLIFDTLSSALPQIRAGKLKLLAVVSDEPVPGHPELPLLTGLLPREAMVGWNGIVVPAKTPRPIVAKLNADIIEAVRSPDVQALLARFDVQTITTTPEAFDAFIRADIGRWATVIKRAGITLDAGS
jgi:tripartite-type tricarboxylate transporter receptor subunit TctC